MKRIWCKLLVFVMLLTCMAVCASAEDIVDIHIIHWSGLPFEEELFQSWARTYEADHPNVRINVESIADGYEERLLTLFSAGEAPDIFYHSFSGLAEMIEQGMIEPLDEYIAQDEDFSLDDLISQDLVYNYNGSVYGWTNGGSPYMLFYNKSMFDAAGLEYPTDEWTYSDLAEAASKLNITDDAGNITTYGFQCDEYIRLWLSIFWSNGGVLFDNEVTPTECLFNSEAGIKATKYMADLVQTFGCAPAPGNTGALSYREAFMNGKAAMVTDGSWQGSQYRSALGDDMGIAMMPLGDSGERYSWSSACTWSIAATGNHKDIAYDIMSTYYCGYEGLLQFCDYGGEDAVTMPIFKAMFEDERYQPCEFVTKCADAMEYCRVDPIFMGANTFEWDILTTAIEEAMILGTDPAEALANAVALTESEILSAFN